MLIDTLVQRTTFKAVDPGEYVSPLAPFVQYLQDALSDLWSSLEAGDLSADAWYAAMLDELSTSYTTAYMAGANTAALTAADLANIAYYIGNQATFLDNFRFEIQSAAKFMKGWRARAESYAAGIAAPYWKGETRVLPLPAQPGDGSTICKSNCKCLWDVQELPGENNFDAFWVLGHADHCQSCLERAATWNPLRIRNGRVTLSYITPGTMESKEIKQLRQSFLHYKHLVGQHNQQHHGNRGPSLSQASDPTWKPSMTRADADAWAANSALPGAFYHGTGQTERGERATPAEVQRRITSITSEGFRWDNPANRKAGERASGWLGPALYFGSDRKQAERYGQVLEVRIKANNPYIVDTPHEWAKTYSKIARISKYKALPPSQRIHQWAQDNNYDAIHIGIVDTVVWNPQQVTVIAGSKELAYKHLVGQHDQHTHGNRGESFSRNGVEGTVVGLIRETSSTTNPDGTRVRIAKLEDVVKIDSLTPDVLNQEGLIATCIRGKNKGVSLYTANSNASHSAMVSEHDQTDSIDNYVRFWVKDKRINAGVVSAGKFINDPEDRFIGMRNIDKAAAQLVKLGLPDKTPLHILDTTNYSQNMTADITLKELADRFLIDRQADRQQYAAFNRFFIQRLKHLAGQHAQRLHGNRGAATLSHGLTAYHITSSDNAAGILQKGLRPASEVGTLGQAPEGQYETEGAFVGNAAQIRVLRNQLLDNDPSTPLTIFEVYLPKKTLVHQDPLMPESSLIIPAGVSPRNLRVVDINAVRDYPAFDDYTQIFKEWRGYKHLAGQHSQRKHGYRGSETSSDSDIDSNIGSLIDDMRHDRTGYLPEGYENRFDGGPGPSIQYHGTGTRLTSFEGADVVYLQDNPSEAIGYATGGHRMQHARGYVLQVRRKPGKSLNINDHLEQRMMEGDDPDAVINTFIKPARARGYDYLYYEHPTFDEANSVQRVLISLNPATSLKVIGSTVAKDFDLLQHIYKGNRFIIYKHITGQHNQKHSRKALQR